MTERSQEKFAEKIVLQQIADKTRPYENNLLIGKIFSIVMELVCYLFFLAFMAAAIYLPGYLEIKLDAVEEEIGFYTLDPEERIVWMQLLTIALSVLSFLPLLTALMLRITRRRGRVLREVFGMVRE